MTELIVQVPVSLIKELRAWAHTAGAAKVAGIGNLYSIIRDIDALLSQQATTDEPKPATCPKCRHASHGAGFCPNWASDNDCSCTFAAEPHAETCHIKRGYISGETYCAVHGRDAGWPCAVTAEPPRIKDMAPGTTFTDDGDNYFVIVIADGEKYAENKDGGGMWPLSDIDPSTIRDVTPPKDAA